MKFPRELFAVFCAALGWSVSAACPAEAASLTTIHAFTGGRDGYNPQTGVVAGPGGALYGATQSTVYELKQNSKGTWLETPILNSGVTALDGLAGSSTALYGIFGNFNSGMYVLELTPPPKGKTVWGLTLLHRFRAASAAGDDGSVPEGLTIAPNGTVFGTTSDGGSSFACGSDNGRPTGCGTLYALTKTNGKWSEKILHAFKGGTDGAMPFAAPALDASGNAFVSTYLGGGGVTDASRQPSEPAPEATSCEGSGQLGYSDALLWEYPSFPEISIWAGSCNPGGPAYPAGIPLPGVTSSAKQNVAGATPASSTNEVFFTTEGGGANTRGCPQLGNGGCGTIAVATEPSDKKTPWQLTSLHDFSGPDGALPLGYLTWDGASTIYGVAFWGGVFNDTCSVGCGTIYSIVRAATGWRWGGVIYKFAYLPRGVLPLPQLTYYKGKLLGTTQEGGIGAGAGQGTIFELTP